MKHRPKNTAVRVTIGAAVLIVSGAMAPAATQSFDFGNSAVGGNSAMSQFFAPTQFPGFGGAFGGFNLFPGGSPFMTGSFFPGMGAFGGMGGFGAFNQLGANNMFAMNTWSADKSKKKNKKKKNKNRNRNKNKVTSKPESKPETKPETKRQLAAFCLSECKPTGFFEEPTKKEPIIVKDDTRENIQPGVVPLPAGGPLLIGGLAALAFLRRRKKA